MFNPNIHNPEDILAALLTAAPQKTEHAPKDSRGIYGLIDHHGDLRYIGSTKSASQTLNERIHHRHRTGSEDLSHYFSRMYNTGRMWRAPKDDASLIDGKVAKALRNRFIAEYCRAVWVPLPDNADIAGLERAVIALAPAEAIRWNNRATEAYAEPVDLVDAIIVQLGFGAEEIAALERQNQRYSAAKAPNVPPFPVGPFRFFALDVEPANHDRASICQIGVACVRPDNTIATWVTYLDPQVDHWAFTYLHKIDARTVRGAPIFRDVLPVLMDAIQNGVVYQHSNFDRGAVAAACQKNALPKPAWHWHDSVQVARRAWPALRGNGGHGLASLKVHLGLSFEHHDAGEDARAAAEVVLHAEAGHTGVIPQQDDDFDLIEDIEDPFFSEPVAVQNLGTIIGRTTLTAGNLAHNHIYLREFFDAFPSDAIGGSNIASAAAKTIAVDWGGTNVEITDLDGQKKFFRRRGWVREFFAITGAKAGDEVVVKVVGPYRYRVSLGHKP
jgi:DNA polymerase III subunit epsilon